MKRRVLIPFPAVAAACFTLVLSLAHPAAAQEEVLENKVYTYVEQMPVLPGNGGHPAIVAAIQERLVYPEEARRQNVQGKVFVAFVVGADGRVKDPKVLKGLGHGCDEAAVAAITQLPRFEPGKQNGRAVAVSYTVPVSFPAAVLPGAAPATTLDGQRVYTYVEQMPALAAPHEKTTVLAAVMKNLVLPAEVRDARSEGQVLVTFAVDPKGAVREPKIVRGLCPACDEAVLDAVRKLPRFVPGQQNGQPVAVNMSLPVQLTSPNHVYPANNTGMRATFAAPGGLYEYLKRNLKVPPVVNTEKLQGRLRVEFVVRADGKVDAVELKNHLCASCDAEALRLVRNFPAWKPARDNADQPIATRQHVDIPMPLPDPSAPYVETDQDKLYRYAEQMPTLLDGSNAFGAAIVQGVRYPESVQRENISGTVYAEYVIDTDGLVRKPRITRGLCLSCDQAVLDAIARLGPVTPAQQNGRPVPMQMRVEVPFVPNAGPASPAPASAVEVVLPAAKAPARKGKK